MPELPEVESIRRALEPELVGRSITAVRVLTRSVVAMPGDPPLGFARARSTARPVPVHPRLLLKGCTVARLARHGKQLAIIAAEGPSLSVHLGMTGGLFLGPRAGPHEHVVWTLAGGARLAFRDARRFGLLAAHHRFEDLRAARWSPLGPDALTITPEALAHACEGSRRAIKALLLDQHVLAGLGNIYADETLFGTGIHPLTPAGALSPARVRGLASLIRRVLVTAIEAGGSTVRNYRSARGQPGGYQSSHRVYARAGHPCFRCSRLLQKLRVVQRTTVFCPTCQPLIFEPK